MTFLYEACRLIPENIKNKVIIKVFVRLHGEYNILVKLCGNTT